jgi:hypothetical protein
MPKSRALPPVPCCRGTSPSQEENSRPLWRSAWAAVRTKNCYLSTQFKRLAARRGSKRALIAVAHRLLVIGYHLQSNGCSYKELGGDYFDQLHAERLKRHLVKRLASLGISVTLQLQAASVDIFEGACLGSERLLPMKKPMPHLIAEVPRSITKIGMTIGIDLGDVWIHYHTDSRPTNKFGQVLGRAVPAHEVAVPPRDEASENQAKWL